MTVISPLPVIGIVASGLAGLLTAIWGNNTRLRNTFGTVGSVIAFASVAAMIPGALQGKIYSITLLKLFSGASISFRADSLGLLFATVSSFMWVIVNIYTIGYMGHEEHKHRFFSFFAMAIFSALGIALSANLINFFIFFELLTLSTYPLVVHAGTEEAYKAGIKYLIYTLTAGGFLLAAIVITYFLAGSLSLAEAGLLNNASGASPLLLRTLFIFYIIGVGVKAGIMPMHHWLPSAMVAPTPVSTLLHAVAVVKAGAFGVLRVVLSIYGIDLMSKLGLGITLMVIASFTIVVASIIAIKQDHLKRRLAYSTIGQLSYIVFGAALLTPAGILAAMIHIANHAVTKGTLFMCAGIITHETGKTNISQLDGIAKRLPITMGAFSVACLGMIGVPPLAGFVSKWYLGIGVAQSQRPFFVSILLVSSILNAAYFLPIVWRAYFKQPEEKIKKEERESVITMLGPITATASCSFLLGLFATSPGLPISIAKNAVAFFTGGRI
ncbi:MAG: monovalent cation/H+ antiporter subunit D family protein [Actinobacteria bacterium]|nr:MAG: monovalent cation/H+ antiporter subunit D family protein [Actinomycetota bacterium]